MVCGAWKSNRTNRAANIRAMAPPAASFDCRGAPSSCCRERMASFCFSSLIELSPCLVSGSGAQPYMGTTSHSPVMMCLLIVPPRPPGSTVSPAASMSSMSSTRRRDGGGSYPARNQRCAALRYRCRLRSGGMCRAVLDQEFGVRSQARSSVVIITPFVPAGWTGRTAYPSDDQSRWSHDGWTVGARPARHRRRSAKSESRTVARGARPAAPRRIAESPESTQGRFPARGPRRSGDALPPAPSPLRPRRPFGVREAAARPTGTRGHPRGLRCRVDRVTPSMGPLSTGTCAYALWSHASSD